MPARNIVVVCSGSHGKKVNLGEVFLTLVRSFFGEVFLTLVRSFLVICSGSHEKKVNLGEVFPVFLGRSDDVEVVGNRRSS
jgi:hypothetical protein